MTDSITTLRPASSDVGSTWTQGGGSTLDGNLADDDSGTFVSPAPYATTPSSNLVLTLDPFTLDDTDQLHYVQLWVDVVMAFPRVADDVVDLTLKLYAPDDSRRVADQVVRVTYPGSGLYTLTPAVSWADGVMFTADDFADGLIVRLRGDLITAATFEGVEIRELGLDIIYNRAPTVALNTANSGSAKQGTSYLHTFAYSDPESDLQERYEDRVYELPAGGFPAGTDDEVIAALETAGVSPVFSEERATDLTTCTRFLATPGYTYRRFVRAADERSGQRFGHWDSDTWAVADWDSSEHPKKITAVVTSDAANASVSLAITETGLGVTPEWYDIERSDDGGVSYQTVVNGEQVARTAATTIFYDRFAPRLVEVIYRIRSVVTEVVGPFTFWFASPWISKSVVLFSDGNSWLQSPDDDTLDLAFIQAGTQYVRRHPENQSVYYAEGRTEPVVFGGTLFLSDGQLNATFVNEAAWQQFEALRALHGKLLLRSLYGEGALLDQWVRLGSPVQETLVGGYSMMTKGQLRRVTVPVYEVTAPNASA